MLIMSVAFLMIKEMFSLSSIQLWSEVGTYIRLKRLNCPFNSSRGSLCFIPDSSTSAVFYFRQFKVCSFTLNRPVFIAGCFGKRLFGSVFITGRFRIITFTDGFYDFYKDRSKSHGAKRVCLSQTWKIMDQFMDFSRFSTRCFSIFPFSSVPLVQNQEFYRWTVQTSFIYAAMVRIWFPISTWCFDFPFFQVWPRVTSELTDSAQKPGPDPDQDFSGSRSPLALSDFTRTPALAPPTYNLLYEAYIELFFLYIFISGPPWCQRAGLMQVFVMSSCSVQKYNCSTWAQPDPDQQGALQRPNRPTQTSRGR